MDSRLRGYRTWLPDDGRLVVMVDRDDDDCQRLKAYLEASAERSGVRSRSRAGASRWHVVNRIVVEELEAWYFGDWQAVRGAYPSVPSSIPNRARYRDPDAISGGTWEAFERLLKRHGYFKAGMPKIEVARRIAANTDPARNRSHSFGVFRDAVAEATG